MENTEVRSSLLCARAAVALLLAIAGLTAACGRTQAAAGPATPTPDKTSAPTACAIRPAPPSTGTETCEETVRRLNGVLSGALSGRLPKSAVLTNNVVSDTGGFVGGEGMTFIAQRRETGGIAFEASTRIRDADRSANLRVEVGFYDAAPAAATYCPDPARAADLKRKGVVMHRCDRTVDAEGSVLFVSDQSAPYGEQEWAKILLRTHFVAVYRKDGIVVQVALEPVVERAPDLSAVVAGDQPTMLTMAQVRALAFDRGLTLTR